MCVTYISFDILSNFSLDMLEQSHYVTGFGKHSVTGWQLEVSPPSTELCHRLAQETVRPELGHIVISQQS